LCIDIAFLATLPSNNANSRFISELMNPHLDTVTSALRSPRHGWRQAVAVLALGLAISPSASVAQNAPAHVVGWGSFALPYVEPGTRFTNIAAGWIHAFAVDTKGNLATWGYNLELQAITPAGLSNVVAASGGECHSLALMKDGTVVGWGWAGDGATAVPGDLTNAAAIAAGSWHSVALRSDGTVVAWGYNGEGQTNVPSDLAKVTAIAAGSSQTLALKSDGSLVAWGELGQNSIPGGLGKVIAIAASDSVDMVLKSDGTVAVWGGQLL
jgi:alpha-tubulin suppressor-like RCC1 family protein